MFDLRPAGYVIGLLLMVLGLTMVIPMGLDWMDESTNWISFALSSFITLLIGSVVCLSCQNRIKVNLNIQQTFFLTTSVWLVLPIFGAMPFILGETEARFTDAFFEAMSGFTTTGSTVLSSLDTLPRGLLLWRGMMQWFGGIGVVVVAMVFLPVLRVGGMQIFRTEGFDTFGKILPRAAEISRSISSIYLTLTVLCLIAYSMAGMSFFDALVHSMTTIATGGFANYDTSFGNMGVAVEYVAVIFMILAALPFVRYVQLIGGSLKSFVSDSQVRTFLITAGIVTFILIIWQINFVTNSYEFAIRKAAFNGVSILTGTGFASDNYLQWGSFPITFFFLIGLIGGCAGSTTCSIKIFRFQLLFASVSAQIKRIHSPNGIFQPRYNKKPVAEDIISSVIAFFCVIYGYTCNFVSRFGNDWIRCSNLYFRSCGLISKYRSWFRCRNWARW